MRHLKQYVLLGTMVGSYNVAALIELLNISDPSGAGSNSAAQGLSRTLMV